MRICIGIRKLVRYIIMRVWPISRNLEFSSSAPTHSSFIVHYNTLRSSVIFTSLKSGSVRSTRSELIPSRISTNPPSISRTNFFVLIFFQIPNSQHFQKVRHSSPRKGQLKPLLSTPAFRNQAVQTRSKINVWLLNLCAST